MASASTFATVRSCTEAVVISHGLVKERIVPSPEIDRAVRRMKAFLKNPSTIHRRRMSMADVYAT